VRSEVREVVGLEFTRGLARQIVTPDLVEAIETRMDAAREPVLIEIAASPTDGAGNVAKGREIFARTDLACANCHAVDGTPGKIGPNLSALGTAQTVEFILGAILDPQKEVKEGFMAHELTAKDGEVYQGYFRGETADEVSLFNHLTGGVVKLRPDQIAERRQLGSLMPAGLADGLSREELRDLVAFLAGLGKR
jgi:putative heme-binding domain-containing protein